MPIDAAVRMPACAIDPPDLTVPRTIDVVGRFTQTTFGLGSLVLLGCSGVLSPGSEPPPDPADESGGGLPTASCAQGPCSACVGCAVWEFGCFGWAGYTNLNSAGYCVASPAQGTLQATVGGVDFVAAQAVAVVDSGNIAISARAGDELVVLFAPATAGVHDCASQLSSGALAYFAVGEIGPTRDFRSPRQDAPVPSCSVTVTTVGEIGQRIEGSFAATLFEHNLASQASLDVANGTFSVERVVMQ